MTIVRKPGSRRLWPVVAGLVLRHPWDIAGAVTAVVATAAIVVNSLYLQPGPHPAPIFAIRPLPVAAHDSTGAIAQLPRARPATAEASRPEPAAVPLPRPRATAPPEPRPDAIADLINSSHQLTAVQRALNEFGYGPIKASGTFDDRTRLAIEQFERDHNLPVTGQLTQRFRREFAAATGRSLE